LIDNGRFSSINKRCLKFQSAR